MKQIEERIWLFATENFVQMITDIILINSQNVTMLNCGNRVFM